MADLDVTRRESPSYWWWALGLLVAVVVAWALWIALAGEGEEPVAEAPVPVVAAVPAPVAVLVPVAQIVAGPAGFTGQPVSGEVRVTEVPTDRGFWVEEGGQRAFVIVGTRAPDSAMNINPGQRIHIAAATVHTGPAGVPGDLDADTRQIVQSLPVFLVAEQADLHLLSPGS